MSRCLRPRRPGATVYFTVALADRGADLLVRHVDLLRDSARRTIRDKPFAVRAWVVLPDHMHCVWTLPEGDADYSNRMGMLKARFSREVRRSGESPTPTGRNPYGVVAGRTRVGLSPDLRGDAPQTRWDEAPIWQKRFWEHHIRDDADFRAAVRYCWINPVKHGLVEKPGDWPYSSWHRDGGGDAMA